MVVGAARPVNGLTLVAPWGEHLSYDINFWKQERLHFQTGLLQ
jgi:hypothetical protein